MTLTTNITWQEGNKRHLMAALEVVRNDLRRHAETSEESAKLKNRETLLKRCDDLAAGTVGTAGPGPYLRRV